MSAGPSVSLVGLSLRPFYPDRWFPASPKNSSSRKRQARADGLFHTSGSGRCDGPSRPRAAPGEPVSQGLQLRGIRRRDPSASSDRIMPVDGLDRTAGYSGRSTGRIPAKWRWDRPLHRARRRSRNGRAPALGSRNSSSAIRPEADMNPEIVAAGGQCVTECVPRPFRVARPSRSPSPPRNRARSRRRSDGCTNSKRLPPIGASADRARTASAPPWTCWAAFLPDLSWDPARRRPGSPQSAEGVPRIRRPGDDPAGRTLPVCPWSRLPSPPPVPGSARCRTPDPRSIACAKHTKSRGRSGAARAGVAITRIPKGCDPATWVLLT